MTPTPKYPIEYADPDPDAKFAPEIAVVVPVNANLWDNRTPAVESFVEKQARDAMAKAGDVISGLTRTVSRPAEIDGVRMPLYIEGIGNIPLDLVLVRFTAFAIPHTPEEQE